MMKEKSLISKLHHKFGEKTWNETFKLVRRCMEKSRDESKPCEPLVRSLERLQEVLHAPSTNITGFRLEMIAKQQGMGFHVTKDTCYLTAGLFYLEVLLLPCGGVQEVKVAPHGEPPAVSGLHLFWLISLLFCFRQRSRNFADFSMKLKCLLTQYDIPGDDEIKFKLLASLQYLGKDLQQISNLPREPKYSNPQMDLVNNGRVGCLTAGKQDCPLTVQFYIHPSDGRDASDSPFRETDLEPAVQAAQVTVGVSEVTHNLQMASVIPQPPQLDPQGCPVFTPLSEVPNEQFSACFLLRLQPAVSMMSSFVERFRSIAAVTVPVADLQWAPLPKLLMRGSLRPNSHWETLDEQEIFTVPVPGGVMHSYVLPGAAWAVPAHRATVVDSVPFSHPAHVPALLELLRHQCAINTLLRSCFPAETTGPAGGRLELQNPALCGGSMCDLRFEVLPESDTSFSVTFHLPHTNSLAVLLVKVCDLHQITCSLFGGGRSDPSLDEYISTVVKRCMSIPVTMRALHSRLEELTSAPLSPSRPAAAEALNDHSSPSSAAGTDADAETATLSQSATVPEDGVGVSASACCAETEAKSELLPEMNSSPSVSP
ncbi:mediator of RNA polymerase II transcription subunit 1-like [Odontesthes bonariensis]|uniref:mediator of RNA polymerase II transcription subunit 1-like n=1 Tax=Odontesthes bonariensis TaxID=219752 RepID=UPI003F583EE5